ncbi:MAG: DinB family protein [Gemmatimonadota bacterium]
MIDEIRELYAYNRWANERILAAVVQLDEAALGRDLGGSFGSVRDTLAHMLAAEWIWLERWTGRSPRSLDTGWDLSGLADIQTRFAEVEERRERFLQQLDDEALHAELDYQNTRGEPFRSALWRLLRHVVNHGTYHRGQVVHQLRQLGEPGVSTDMVLFDRTRTGA